jgi:predicted dehydrogenase
MEIKMKMRLAISGAGFIANTHITAIEHSGKAEVIAVVEHFSKKAEEFSWAHGVKCNFRTVEELLKAEKIDGLIVGVPNALHAPQTIAALKAGVAVLVEKPMAMNAKEAEKMVEASEKSGAPLMVGQCWRFDEEVNWLKDQVDAGKLGKIIRTKSYGVHFNWGPSGWFIEKKLAGGGALVDMGVHALDTTRYLLGDPKPVSVYANLGTNYIKCDVEDTAVMMVNWDNDVSSYIESGWWQPHMDGPEAATQLYGKKGFGSVFPSRLEILNKETAEVDIIESGFEFPKAEHFTQEMYDRQMAAFIEAIQTRKTPNPGGMEGLTNMKVLDAAYKSAETGKVVEIK